MITKPMLAFKIDDITPNHKTSEKIDHLKFPYLGTPKIDGIRCLKVEGKALSRSFKPIPNRYVRGLVEKHCPDGYDGELVVNGGCFNSAQSAFMSYEGEPDFSYMVFDYIQKSLNESYESRCQLPKVLTLGLYLKTSGYYR